jgi:hypothetical protein
MFIHRRYLSEYRQNKIQIINQINIICQKINIKLYLTIEPPSSIFNDLEKHILHKKKLNTNTYLLSLLSKLHEIYNDLKKNNFDMSKIKYIKMMLKRP